MYEKFKQCHIKENQNNNLFIINFYQTFYLPSVYQKNLYEKFKQCHIKENQNNNSFIINFYQTFTYYLFIIL